MENGAFNLEEVQFLAKLVGTTLRQTINDRQSVYKLERKYGVELDFLVSKIEDGSRFTGDIFSKLQKMSGGTLNEDKLIYGRRS